MQRPAYAMGLGMTPATAQAQAQEQAQEQAQSQMQEQAQEQRYEYAFQHVGYGVGKYKPRTPRKPQKQFQMRLDLPDEKPVKKIKVPKKLRKKSIGYKERTYDVPSIWGGKTKTPQFFKPPKITG